MPTREAPAFRATIRCGTTSISGAHLADSIERDSDARAEYSESIRCSAQSRRVANV